MGGVVAVALAEQASELVDRLVDHRRGARTSDGELAAVPRQGSAYDAGDRRGDVAADARLAGQGRLRARRSRPASTRRRLRRTPTRSSTTTEAMTYTSFNDAHDAADDYVDEIAARRSACADRRGAAAGRSSAPRTRSATPTRRSQRLRGRARRADRGDRGRRPLAERREARGDGRADRASSRPTRATSSARATRRANVAGASRKAAAEPSPRAASRAPAGARLRQG